MDNYDNELPYPSWYINLEELKFNCGSANAAWDPPIRADDLVKVGGSQSMQAACNRGHWRYTGKSNAQQWTRNIILLMSSSTFSQRTPTDWKSL